LIKENKTNRKFNVGVDFNDFTPVSLDDIMEAFKEQWLVS
jgi:calcineurin-like phosphoesterase family protein